MALDTAVVCLVTGGILGAVVPALIGRIPEPPEPAESAGQAEPAGPLGADGAEAPAPKVPYAEIGASPRLVRSTVLVSAVVAALLGSAVGWDWALLFLIYLVPVGVALAVVDWRTRMLPTWLIAPSYAVVSLLVILSAALSGEWDSAIRAALGWAVAGGMFFLLWFIYPRGLGYGDVRLSGVLGIALGYLGWGELLVGVYAAFVLGGVGGLLLSALKIVDRKASPFGPWMLVGAVVGVLAGPAIADYLATAYA